MKLLIGLILGIVIAVAAWRLRTLSRSGAYAAAISGGLIFGLGGLPWAVLLLTFFISSSALSRAFSKRKASLTEKFSKGSQRDWGQVLANGGLGAGLAVLHAFLPGQTWPWIAFAGAMAAVNADTWATEVGVLNPSPPRMLTTWQPVERGSSGAISWLGSLAALTGGGLVALLAYLFYPALGFTSIWVGVTLGAAGGSFFDSLLGATVQAIYWCPNCKKETERHPLHLCGAETSQIRGWSWLNNDWVNFGASLAGALLALGLYTLLS